MSQDTPEQDIFSGSEDSQKIQDIHNKIQNFISTYIVGQPHVTEALFICMLCNGHALLEGVPGVAKTLWAKLLAKSIQADFSRIQFTPDLMPTDVLGATIFNVKNSEFEFHPGPIFSQIILIDEINRSPAKTQSALFEVMEEKQATIDGTTYSMKAPFMVVATQNPVEQEGTYRLPEAQLDRFFFRIKVFYPNMQEEVHMLLRFHAQFKIPFDTLEPVITSEELLAAQKLLHKVEVEPSLLKYIAGIIQASRNHPSIYLGASPRASLTLMLASKAKALIQGRNFVIPEDIQSVAEYCLNHRLIIHPEAEMEGITNESIIEELVKTIEVPR